MCVNTDINSYILHFLQIEDVLSFCSTCKANITRNFAVKHNNIHDITKSKDVIVFVPVDIHLYDITFKNISKIIISAQNTFTLHNAVFQNCSLFFKNVNFAVESTIQVTSSLILLSNSNIQAINVIKRIFFTNSSRLILNKTQMFGLSSLIKCNHSILIITSSNLNMEWTKIPLIVLRLSSLSCCDSSLNGGNVGIFINGRPLHFMLNKVTFHRNNGVELYRCRLPDYSSITNCKQDIIIHTYMLR